MRDPNEISDKDADRMQALAEEIRALADNFKSKKYRYTVHDAAKLIEWLVYDAVNPDDPEAQKAIASLRAALGDKNPSPSN